MSENVPHGLETMKIRSTTELGVAIRKRRKSLRLTQVQAAGLCGVGDRFLRELERGKATAELAKVLQVLRGLGLGLDLISNEERYGR